MCIAQPDQSGSPAGGSRRVSVDAGSRNTRGTALLERGWRLAVGTRSAGYVRDPRVGFGHGGTDGSGRRPAG